MWDRTQVLNTYGEIFPIMVTTVVLPIENKHREFDGMVWLATNLIKNNYEVALGNVSDIKLISKTEIKPDFYFTRTTKYSDRKYEFYKSLKRKNCEIFALDPEGIWSGARFFEQRIANKKILEVYDELLLPGEGAKSSIVENTEYPEGKMHAVGNPRFDLLQPDLRPLYSKRNKMIKNEFGEYILINTNFASVNHNSRPYDPNNRNYIKYDELSNVKYQAELLELFIEMGIKLSQNHPNTEIIIRPHPGESHKYYVKKTREHPNITVKQQGDVRDWIIGADVVIHNNCTTGIESSLLNKPTIAYQPDINGIPLTLPNKISTVANTLDGLIDAVDRLSGTKYTLSDHQIDILSNRIHNIKTKSALDILKVIKECERTHKGTDYSPSNIDEYGSYIKDQFLSKHFKRIIGPIDSKSKHKKKKFPGLDKQEINETMNEFIHPSKYKITPLNNYNDVYWIRPSCRRL